MKSWHLFNCLVDYLDGSRAILAPTFGVPKLGNLNPVGSRFSLLTATLEPLAA